MIRYFKVLSLLIILFSFQANPVFSQDARNNPQVMAQIRAILTAKGLTEDEVKTRLKTKNIDIDKMTDQEIIAQRPAIEAIINEMEQEKKQKMGAANVIVDTNKIKAIIDSNDEQVGKAKQAEQYAPVVPTREEPKSPNSIYGHHIFKDNTLQAYRISKRCESSRFIYIGTGR